MTRYQHLANLLAERIEQGLYRSGERLPSVRTLSQEHGVSISTIQQAYQILEKLQLITPSRVPAILSLSAKPSPRSRP
jgi:DNA-binding transcriptional MocR family regulator